MRKLLLSVIKSPVLTGALRGMGGAAVAAIGWKLASDAYDLLKARALSSRARAAQSEAPPDKAPDEAAQD